MVSLLLVQAFRLAGEPSLPLAPILHCGIRMLLLSLSCWCRSSGRPAGATLSPSGANTPFRHKDVAAVPAAGAGLPAGWGNNELECYSEPAAHLDGQGHLIITAQDNGATATPCMNPGAPDGAPGSARYTSARCGPPRHACIPCLGQLSARRGTQAEAGGSSQSLGCPPSTT